MIGNALLHFRNMKYILLIIAIIVSQYCYAQKYLLNGDFEIMKRCPSGPGDINLCTGWFVTEGSPDYFNTCYKSKYILFGIPSNYEGCMPAYSGVGYAGLYLMYYDKNIKLKKSYVKNESIYTPLISSFEIGSTYNISFYISLSDSSIITSDSIYVSLSVDKPYYKKGKLIENFMSKGAFIKNKNQYWQHISIDINADDRYKYLYIGLPRKKLSFSIYKDLINNNSEKFIHETNEIAAYYYVDNIQIIKNSEF